MCRQLLSATKEEYLMSGTNVSGVTDTLNSSQMYDIRNASRVYGEFMTSGVNLSEKLHYDPVLKFIPAEST